MLLLAIVAQEANLPTGGVGQAVFWILGAAVILGLWYIVHRTRKRSYNEYWERRRAEEQRRLNDPDMARPPDVSDEDSSD